MTFEIKIKSQLFISSGKKLAAKIQEFLKLEFYKVKCM